MAGRSIVVRCPDVVSRPDELAAIDALIDKVRTGRGGVLAIEGDAGLGKSRLVAELVTRCASSGVAAAVGRASTSALVPFRAIGEAFLAAERAKGRPDDERLAAYRPLVTRLVRSTGNEAEPADMSLLALAEAFRASMEIFAGDRGLIVVLEDLHWADQETLALVEYLVDNIRDTRLGVLLTARPGASSAVGMIRQLWSRGSLDLCTLCPLSPSACAQMVQRCLGAGAAPLPAELTETVWDSSAGLPLIVEDLLAALIDADLLVESDDHWAFLGGRRPIGARFAEIVRQRAATLNASERAVLDAAAVLGSTFDWRLLSPMTALPDRVVGAALQRLTDAQLLAPGTDRDRAFRHTLTAEVLLADLDPSRALGLRSAGAAALAAAGSDSDEEVALQARLRAEAGEAIVSVALLVDAAARAMARGGLLTAEDHLRQALAITPEDLKAQLLLLEVLVHRGEPNEALGVGQRLLDRALDREDRSAAELLVARAELAGGDAPAARRHLQRARAGASSRRVAEIAVLDAYVAISVHSADRLVAAEHLARRALALAEAAAEPAMRCEALELIGRCARVRDLTSAGEAFEQALEIAERYRLAVWRMRALNELGTIDMFRDADPARLQAARRAAAAAGSLTTMAGVDVNLAALHTMRGEYDLARQAAESGEELACRGHLTGLLAGGLVMQAVVATHEGRFADMRLLVERAEAIAGDDPDVIVGTRAMCRGVAALLQEDRVQANHHFAKATAASAARPPLAINPVDGPWLLIRAVEGRAGVADVDAYRAAQAAGARWSAMWEGFASAAAVGITDPHRAQGGVEDALAASEPMPLFRAIGLRLVGERAALDGWGEPERWLTDAAGTFSAGGHSRPAAACRDLLRQAGSPVARPRLVDRAVPAWLRRFGVTAREHEVLLLVGERRSNKDIAERLYLSPRTVEKHVSSLLTKTASPDRAALVMLAAEVTTT